MNLETVMLSTRILLNFHTINDLFCCGIAHSVIAQSLVNLGPGSFWPARHKIPAGCWQQTQHHSTQGARWQEILLAESKHFCTPPYCCPCVETGCSGLCFPNTITAKKVRNFAGCNARRCTWLTVKAKTSPFKRLFSGYSYSHNTWLTTDFWRKSFCINQRYS